MLALAGEVFVKANVLKNNVARTPSLSCIHPTHPADGLKALV